MSIIDDYLQTIAAPQREALEHIRGLVRKLVPDAEETKSYGMPAFRYKGKYLVAFFAFKDHLSLFPTAGPVAAVKDRLDEFTWAKGTIQFTPEHPLPDDLITVIIQNRLQAIEQAR